MIGTGRTAARLLSECGWAVQTWLYGSLVRLFHRNRAWKQNVVLQVNVLVEIGFKIRERLVQRLVADTRIAWSRVATTGFPNRTQCVASGIVLMFHHGHWVLYATERGR